MRELWGGGEVNVDAVFRESSYGTLRYPAGLLTNMDVVVPGAHKTR